MTEKGAAGEPPAAVEADAGPSGARASNSLVRSQNAKGPAGPGTPSAESSIEALRATVRELGGRLGRSLKLLVAQPNVGESAGGVEAQALRARDAGFEVVYQATRPTAAELAQTAVEEDVHLVGLGVPSGSSDEVVLEVVDALRAVGVGDVPVAVIGNLSIGDLVERIRRAHGLS